MKLHRDSSDRYGTPKVALFLPHLVWGGAERVMLDLSREFLAAQVRVDLVAASAEGELMSEVPPGVDVVDLGVKRVGAAWLPLVSYLRRVKPNVLLSTLEHANVLALMAGTFAPATSVVIREANTVSLDADRSGPRGSLLYRLMRAVYPRASKVVAVSEGVAHDLREHMSVRSERIVVIPNPVLTPTFHERAASEPEDLGLFEDRKGQPVVLGVGRMVPQKDFATLVKAFARTGPDRNAKLVILGEGPLRADLEALARELGIADRVFMPGFRQNPFAYMSRADAFVLSSAWEGLPNVLIQALAAGAPIVATDCRSGPSEVLAGGKYGRLVPVGDVEGMATAIDQTLSGDTRVVPQAWIDQFQSSRVARMYLDAMGLA